MAIENHLAAFVSVARAGGFRDAARKSGVSAPRASVPPLESSLMQSLKEEHIPYRVAEWLPSDHAHLKRWLDGMIQKTDAGARRPDRQAPGAGLSPAGTAAQHHHDACARVRSKRARRMPDQHYLRLGHGHRRRHGGVSESASECAAQESAERVGAVPALERLHLCAERRSPQRLVRGRCLARHAELREGIRVRSARAALGLSFLGRLLHAPSARGRPPRRRSGR